MVNVLCQEWGLIASVTQFVHFGALGGELKKRLHAAAVVNSKYSRALKPGTKIADILIQGAAQTAW
jgi:Xaa-Pro dipeptidase